MTVRLPMRVTETVRSQADAFIADGNYVMEQKMDGTRALFSITPGGVLVYGSQGVELAHTAATQHLPKIKTALMELMKHLPRYDTEIVLDGEIMIETGELWVFDLPSYQIRGEHFVTPLDPFWERRASLEGLFTTQIFKGTKVHLLAQARTAEYKAAMWREVQRAGAEGVMVKHVDGRYEPGQRVSHQLKLKLVKTADVIVLARDVNGAKNATLGVWDGRAWLKVGGCSMIGKPNAMPGDVIEIQYLYFTNSGSVYQPRMMRVRNDKAPEDCLLDQFQPYSRAVVKC